MVGNSTYALAVFSALQVLDAITTQMGISAGIQEGNLLPALILANGGIFSFVLVKAAIVLWVAALPDLLPRFRRLRYLPHLGSAFLALAVARNISLIA